MSLENVEIVRQVIESNRSNDRETRVEAVLALCNQRVEYTAARAVLEPATYRGHGGMRRYSSDLADSWAEWRSEPEDIIDVGLNTVVATIRFRATGKDSGAPVDTRLGAVFVLSDGKLLRGHTYPSREEALAAVGLSE
jgi:ketosteroid isomerase-like protein